MTKDDILRLARGAGFNASNGFSALIVRHSNGSWIDVADDLERFANLVVAAEREECAKLCEDETEDVPLTVMADAIRARSQS